MHNFVHVMLNGSAAALRIEALWKVEHDQSASIPFSRDMQEYEEQKSEEAKFVKGTSLFELASQNNVLSMTWQIWTDLKWHPKVYDLTKTR